MQVTSLDALAENTGTGQADCKPGQSEGLACLV
jgi:hypothetical protein